MWHVHIFVLTQSRTLVEAKQTASSKFATFRAKLRGVPPFLISRRCAFGWETNASFVLVSTQFGNLSKARSLFEKGLEADRGNPFVCHAWGLLEEKDGNTDLARELFKVCLMVVAVVNVSPSCEVCDGSETPFR